MIQLGQSDLRAIRHFVRECYAIRELSYDQFVRRLVCTLPQLIPANHVTYNEMYPDQSKSHNCVNTAELATPHAAGLWEQHMNEHPVMMHVLRTGDRHAARISDFWSRRELHDRGLHSDFYRQYGIEDALCTTVLLRPPRIIGIVWHDNRIFTDRERSIAEMIRPHLAQACQNARIVSRLHRQLRALEAGIESMGEGMIICDANGQVQAINAPARQCLAEYMGTSRDCGRSLPDELLRWMQQQNANRFHTDVPLAVSPLVYEKEDRRLVVRLFSRNGANVLMMEESRAIPDSGTLDRFGLTPRESEVLAWIAQGKTNSEIAVILNASVGTVKKHVEHVFLKLGVETRTGAAALALNSSYLAQA